MPISKKLIIKAFLLRKLRRRLKRKARACDIRSIFRNRVELGEHRLVNELRDDPEYHKKYFRMSKEVFDELMEKVEGSLTQGRKHSRPITKLEKLAVTLRYLATGNSQMSMSFSFRISPSSIGLILRETMEAICIALEPEHLSPPDTQTWSNIAENFASTWNFPNCCGAMDGKHIRIVAPKFSGSVNYNYKGFYSVILLAIVDAKYRFTLVDIGASGSQSDGGVLARSKIGTGINDGTLELPNSSPVGSMELPYVLTADDAFPLKTNIMKPYPGRGLTVERRIFNYRMSRARMVSENAFGILAARFRIFQSAIQGGESLVRLIIRTCVILHNFLMDRKENSITADQIGEESFIPGSWREMDRGNGMQSINIQGSNNHTLSASNVRDAFKDYFNGEGAVPWQNRMI